MKKIKFTLWLLWSVCSAFAQQFLISGHVSDEQGNPLAGVTIRVEDNHTGSVTNGAGNYEIRAPRGGILVFTYVGMKEVKQKAEKNTLHVVMQTDMLSIDPVVVVAYGVQQRSSLASAVASVKNERLSGTPAYSMEQALQGKMPGVRMTLASGVPGTHVVARVRGASSFSAGNDPLFVVDGIPVNQATTTFTNYGHENLSPIADLNPSDIASVEVLKDASASALYGSRASNGVILITTKKGIYNQNKIEFDTYYGLQDLVKKVKYTDAKTWITIQNEARENYNRDNGFTAADKLYQKPVGDPSDPLADVDWMDQIMRNRAAIQNYQLSFSGGNDQMRSFLSLGYFGQEGLLLGNRYEKYSLRTNVDRRMNSCLAVGTNLSINYMKTSRVHGSNNIYSPWSNALKQRPDEPPYAKDGSYFPTSEYNPIQTIRETEYNTRRLRLIGSVYGILNFTKELQFKTQLGGDFSFLAEHTFESAKSLQGKPSNGVALDGRSWIQQLSTENLLTYQTNIKNLHMDLLVGQSYQKNTSDYNSVTGKNFPSDALHYISSASLVSNGSSTWTGHALLSYFARAKFLWHEKYILEGSIRRDGSSKFLGNNRFGTFPSVAAAWLIDRESFFPENDVLNHFKLRTSYGLTGNQSGISDFASRSQLSAAYSYDDKPGFAIGTQVNKDLRWEKTRQFDLGFDLGFWNHRVSITADYYHKTTVDLLMNRTLPSTSGFSSMIDNIGSVRNQGIECSAVSHNLTGKFKWTTHLNIAHEWNKVLKLNQTVNGEWVDMATGWNQIHSVGHSIGSYYLIVSDGVYQHKDEVPQALWDKGVRPGDMRYVDYNQDGTIDSHDRQILQAPEPKLYGGFDNSFTYQNIDLLISTYFMLGNKLYALWASNDGGANLGYSLSAITQQAADSRWIGEGTSTHTPRAVYGTQGVWNTMASDRFFEDASFLKIKDITLGYNVPPKMLHVIGVQKLRLYAKVQNLMTFTSYSGFDPEVMSVSGSITGTDQGTQPQPRSFLFGLHLTL